MPQTNLSPTKKSLTVAHPSTSTCFFQSENKGHMVSNMPETWTLQPSLCFKSWKLWSFSCSSRRNFSSLGFGSWGVKKGQPNVFPFQRKWKTCKSQIADTEHTSILKIVFVSYNFIFNLKTWGPIILRHCSSHVCHRLVTSIFLSPATSMCRCLESACSFCSYIIHITYTSYHHAVGSNKRAFTHPSKQAQNQGPQLPLRFLQHFIKYLSSVHRPLAFEDQRGNACILARGPHRHGSIFLLKKSRRGWSPKEQASKSWDHASWELHYHFCAHPFSWPSMVSPQFIPREQTQWPSEIVIICLLLAASRNLGGPCLQD